MYYSFKSAAAVAAVGFATSSLAIPAFSSTRNLAARANAPTNLCGDDQSLILSGTPWIAYNMMYAADQMQGTCCTGFQSTATGADGNLQVKWNSTWAIDYVTSTDNVPKGYSFIGLTQNLGYTLAEIESVPATYDWTRTNTTAYKGNTCFDFMTSNSKTTTTSATGAQELMLWLSYDGGQLPIGWTGGPTHTISSLYGTSWKLYQGMNTDSNIQVSSLLPDTQFDGTFSGDIKDWLDAMRELGVFDANDYVTTGNAGTEPFYGDAVLEATLGLQVNLGTDSAVWSDGAAASATTAAALAESSTAAPTSTSATSTEVAVITATVVPVAVSSSSSVAAEVTFVLPSSSAAAPSTMLATIETSLTSTTALASSTSTSSTETSSTAKPSSPAEPTSSTLPTTTAAASTASAAEPTSTNDATYPTTLPGLPSGFLKTGSLFPLPTGTGFLYPSGGFHLHPTGGRHHGHHHGHRPMPTGWRAGKTFRNGRWE